MNKFEQISGDDHQVSVAGRCRYPGPMSAVKEVGTVKPNALWVIVTWNIPQNIHTQVKTLPSRNFVGGQ